MDQNGSAAYLQMAATQTKTSDTPPLQPLSAGQQFIIGNCKNVLTHDLNLRQHQFYSRNDLAKIKCKLVTCYDDRF